MAAGDEHASVLRTGAVAVALQRCSFVCLLAVRWRPGGSGCLGAGGEAPVWVLGVEKTEVLVPVGGFEAACWYDDGFVAGDVEAPAESGQCVDVAGVVVRDVAEEAVGEPVEVVACGARW